ncbi:MAG: NAD(P)-dependent oxidoreductase [Pseudomonadota bacterium]
MRYGVIGLGSLGGHLPASLAKAGFEVWVNDLDRALADRHLALGAHWADSPAAIAANTDAVITCLPSPTASEAVLDAMLPAMRPAVRPPVRPGTGPAMHWIEMSTVSRADVLRLAEKAAAAEIGMLEAPVTGGVHLAARGEITVLVGGDQAVFETHRPAFDVMGGRIFHLGPLGQASVVKVITNMMAFIHLQSCAEGLMLAAKGGIDLATAWQAIAASSGNSFVHETEGQLILNGSYDIAFTMDLALKDLGFASGFAREFGLDLPLLERTSTIFEDAKARYGGQAQSPMIARLQEEAAGLDLRAPGFPGRLE